MLVKQAWKFIFNLNIVVSRIFEAKYFFKKALLEVNVGYNPSYDWVVYPYFSSGDQGRSKIEYW